MLLLVLCGGARGGGWHAPNQLHGGQLGGLAARSALEDGTQQRERLGEGSDVSGVEREHRRNT